MRTKIGNAALRVLSIVSILSPAISTSQNLPIDSTMGMVPHGVRIALVQEEVVVAYNPDLKETTYKIAVTNCTITWTVFSSEVNREAIGQHSDCALPLEEQALLIAKLLRRVLETREVRQFHTLSWGRLYPEYPDRSSDASMAVRLGVAAKRSSQWDSARGVPRHGRVNDWVRDLANDAAIYQELQPVFAEAGLELRISSIEKVLVTTAGRLPFFEALRKSGVHASDLVPWDCLVWFSVRPNGSTDNESP